MVSALEQFAPLPLQEDYDNAGLQIGLTETEVSGVLLCLDVNEQIVDEAVALGYNLIVAHHPLIFHPLSHITDEDYVQRTVIKAIKHSITIVAIHTNIDNAKGGVNFKIAEKIGLNNINFLAPKITNNTESGSGTIGELTKPMAADDFIIMLKHLFDTKTVMCNQLLHREIRRVAICGGAGSFLLKDAINAEADAFVTGEMHYHEYFGHEQEIQIAIIGHYQSEQFTSEIFKSIIEEQCEGVRCYISQLNTNPIIYL